MGLGPTYRDSIGVRPEQVISPRQGEFANPLADGQRMARSLLATAEPIMVNRAQEAALDDAGSADLVKDAEGNYQLPDPPKGGMVYAKVYDEALNERLVVETMFDFESQANEVVGTFRNDPNGFLMTMRARAEAKLDGAPAGARLALEKLLSREILERHRGLADDKTRRDFVNEVNGIQTTLEAKTMRASRLLMTGTVEGRRQAEEIIASTSDDRVRLVGMGALGPEGAAAEADKVASQLGNEIDYSLSMETMAGIAPMLAQASDDELLTFKLWADGIDTPGKKIDDIDFATFRASMPSPQVMNSLQSVIGGELGVRQQARSEALAAQRHADTVAAAQAAAASTDKLRGVLERKFADDNYNSTMGLDRDEVAVIDQQFGSIHDNMQTPQGASRTLGLISQYGTAPKQLIQYLDGSIDGDNMKAAVGFIASMQQLNVKGNNVGNQLFDQLAPKTRAVFQIYAKGMQAGASEATIQGQVEAYRRGPTFTVDDARKLVGARGGERVDGGVRGSYDQQRAAAVAKLTKAPVGIVSVAGPVLAAFDDYLPIAMQVHNGNIDAAMEDAARSVGANFKPHRIFLGGFGPAQMFQHNVALGALSAALPGRGPKNPTGAKLKELLADGSPRVRLQPLYNAPLVSPSGQPVLGRYRVLFFDANGRQNGDDVVDMDSVMGLARQLTASERRAAAPIPAAPTGKRWQLRTDPRTNKVRYMDTTKGK